MWGRGSVWRVRFGVGLWASIGVVALLAPAAQAQVGTVSQGTSVLVRGTGICTVGYNDYANRRSFVAAHCGQEGARVELLGPRTGAVGTFYRSKAYDGQLSNDWAAIQWDAGVQMGPNRISGNAWVHPNDIRLGETVCYYGRTSHAGGGQTCGAFAGSADNTFFVDAALTRPGDSGGPVWVPGRGFVGVVSSAWASKPLSSGRAGDFVVGVVPRDGAPVPELRVLGMWVQTTLFPGLTGPAGEAVRAATGALFGALASIGLRLPAMVNYG